MNARCRTAVIQKLAAADYRCLEATQRSLCFSNAEESVELRFEMRCYPRLRGRLSHIRELSCDIMLHYGYHAVERFSACDFRALGMENDVLVCEGEEQLAQTLSVLVDRLLTDVIPVLDRLAASLVRVEEAFYERLSCAPEQRAAEFAAHHGRNACPLPDEQAWAEAWLRGQKEARDREADALPDRSDELIDFAAYIGSLILAKHRNGRWAWWPQCPGEERRVFGLDFPDEDDGYDVISAVLRVWNFADCFRTDGLFPTLS